MERTYYVQKVRNACFLKLKTGTLKLQTYYVQEQLGTSFVVCIVLTSLVVIGAADENSTIFNVLDYGASGDGQNDDSQVRK